MIRLFVALAVPDRIADRLFGLQAGVPGARWQTREQLHITLRFIGEVPGHHMRDVDSVLSGIPAPALGLRLKSVGEFGGKKPRALWTGVASEDDTLLHFQRKIETALQRLGLAAEPRKYTPHVTLARLRAAPVGAVMDWLTDHALFETEPWQPDAFHLYSSMLTGGGSIYRIERSYPLGAAITR
jgi:2'-5' RNA ligase